VLSEVREFAENWNEKENHAIHCLIHNAGALSTKREETKEGNEQTLATQVLGPYLLTSLLDKQLRASAPSRVIFVSSAGMYTQKLDLDNLQSKKKKFDGTATYAQMKRAQIIMSEEFARRFEGSGVTVNAMHPGWTVTPGLTPLFEDKPFYKRFETSFRPVQQGADTLLWLAINPKLDSVTGKFFFDREEQNTHVKFAFTKSSKAEKKAFFHQLVQLTSVSPG